MTTLARNRAEALRLDALRLEMDADKAYAMGHLALYRRLAASAQAQRQAAQQWAMAMEVTR